MQVKIPAQHQVESNGSPGAAPDRPTTENASCRSIRHLTWLSDGLLLTVGSEEINIAPPQTATIIVRGQTSAAVAQLVAFGEQDGSVADQHRATLILVRCEPGMYKEEVPQRLVLGAG